ncbi:MAG: FtsX-like permease family protein [Gammaproteobacteria bacterium]|nr:FtsX-like permease family protein [Gammaproteobacteria bacterium]
MEIRPILSAMLRNKTGPILIALQIAITMALIANSMQIINEREDIMARPTGMDEGNIVFASSIGFTETYDQLRTWNEDRDTLLAIPGVTHVGYMNRAPLSGGGSSSTFKNQPGEGEGVISEGIAYYNGDQYLQDALGLELDEGRWFLPEEVYYQGEDDLDEITPAVVITRTVADKLFPEGNALESMVYNGLDQPRRVVGIIKHMQGPWLSWNNVDHVMIYGRISAQNALGFMIHTEPGMADKLMPEIETALQQSNRERVVTTVRTLQDYKMRSYAENTAMVGLLSIVSWLLIGITALGTLGLAAFNVNQRRKQIGTRRALGATKADILRYFLLEGGLIALLGVALGTVLSMGLSWLLGTNFGVPRIEWYQLLPIVIGLLLLAVLAVLGPAQRATRVPPAMATRSV